MEPQSKSKNLGIFAGIIVVVLVVLVTVFMGRKSANTPVTDQTSSQTNTTDQTTTTQTTPADTVKKSAVLYKDGTYTAVGSYMSPGGPDQIGVTLTLKDDVISDISIQPMPGDPKSVIYQNKFASGYKQLVLGKNISDVNLTVVSGSSLTPIGFNDAIAQIKAKAKV